MSTPRQRQPSIVVGDAEYLKALSGYKQKTAIASWCTHNKIKFFRNAKGWPVTTEAALERALDGRAMSQPDWSLFEEREKYSTHWRYWRRRQEMGMPEPTTEASASKVTTGRRKRSE
jgi:hypothetical protein